LEERRDPNEELGVSNDLLQRHGDERHEENDSPQKKIKAERRPWTRSYYAHLLMESIDKEADTSKARGMQFAVFTLEIR